MIANILNILVNIILPVFFLIAIGYILQKKFEIGVNAQVKLLVYAVIPSILFMSIYESKIEGNLVLSIILFCLLHFSSLYIAGWAVSRLRKHTRSETGIFINSVMLFNVGNYCIPLMTLIFNDSYAISLLVIVILVSSTTSYTIGVFNVSLGQSDIKNSLKNIFKLPFVYSIVVALLLRYFDLELWRPVNSTLQILEKGLVPLGLTTLGIQLAQSKVSFGNSKANLSNLIRLIVSPVLAFLLVSLLGIEGMAAQVLIIASAAPTAVNTIILALEYNNEPDFASQTVFSSTILSTFTVSIVIYLATTYL